MLNFSEKLEVFLSQIYFSELVIYLRDPLARIWFVNNRNLVENWDEL